MKKANVFERGRGVHEIKLHYLIESAIQLLEEPIPFMTDEWVESARKLRLDYESVIEEEKKRSNEN